MTENITATIWDVHTSQEIKNAGSHSNQDGACQERRNVLAEARGVNFNAWRRLPVPAAWRRSPWKGKPWSSVSLFPNSLSSWQNTAQTGAWKWRWNGAIKAAVSPSPACCDPPLQNSHSLCFPTPQLCEETIPVQSCVQIKALWRETGITQVFLILCLYLRGKFWVYWN